MITIIKMKPTQEDITLIDDFMAWPNGELPKIEGSIPFGNYSNSWDWLIPVFEKINGMGKPFNFAIFKTYVSLSVEKSGNKFYKDFSFSHSEYITEVQTSKEAMFKIIIKFIKWYNDIPKKVLICNNCKAFWIAPKEQCSCGSTTLTETHQSNLNLAN